MGQYALNALGFDERRVTPAVIGAPQDGLIERARVELKAREHRHRHFPSSLFGEPAWEMLIALYLSQEGYETVCNLINGCQLPHATGLRWLHVLENHHLVRRRPHHKDKRVILIELTENAQCDLDNYFSARPWI